MYPLGASGKSIQLVKRERLLGPPEDFCSA
jgi:hypothetical protein